VLANLLPGLREIRAPLSAGYLFIVTGWIILHERVDVGEGASSTVDAVRGLQNQLGAGALAAAISFLAYLLGALWEPVAAALERALWAVRTRWARPYRWIWRYSQPQTFEPEHFLPPAKLARWTAAVQRSNVLGSEDDESILDFPRRVFRSEAAWTPPPDIRLSGSGWQQLRVIARRLFTDVDELVRTGLQISDTALRDEVTRLSRFDRDHADLLSLARGVDAYLREPEPTGSTEVIRALAAHIPSTLPSSLARMFWIQRILTYSEEDLGCTVDELVRVRSDSLGTERDHWWMREAPGLVTRYDSMPSVALKSEDWPLMAVKTAGEDSTALITVPGLMRAIFRELPLSARRLVAEEEKLFLEVDRMQSEITFRFTLAIPIAVAVATVAIGLSVPLWALAPLLLIAIGAGAALLIDGWRRDREQRFARRSARDQKGEVSNVRTPRTAREIDRRGSQPRWGYSDRSHEFMTLYGIASGLSGDIWDWYPSRDEAEATLASILRDEPDFEGELWVEAVELEQSPN
jgi:hypothetical protein